MRALLVILAVAAMLSIAAGCVWHEQKGTFEMNVNLPEGAADHMPNQLPDADDTPTQLPDVDDTPSQLPDADD